MAPFMVQSQTGVFYDPDQIKRNLVALNDQRNLSQFCDVVLKVCGTQIYAHSNILAAASPYFGSTLDLGVGTDCPRGFSQKQPQVIEIHIDLDLDLAYGGDGGYGEAVNKVVEFMYTSYITLTPSLVSQVVEIGKIMQVEKLLQFCEQFQNGADSNYPRDVSTCTTGLQEVANLLSSRAKRVDVFTETEEIMFEKVHPNTNSDRPSSQKKQKLNQMACTVSDEPTTSLGTRLTHDEAEEIDTSISTAVSFDSIDQNEKDASLSRLTHNEAEEIDTSISAAVSFDSIDQNEKDASLLLAFTNDQPPLNLIGIRKKTVNNANEFDESKLSAGDKGSSPLPMNECTPISSHIQNKECQSSSLTSFDSTPSHETCMSNDKTICEMMNLSVSVIKPNPEDVASQGSSACLNSNVLPPEVSLNSSYVQVKLKKDIHVDEKSDLVKFDRVTTALFHSNLRGRSSGRPRGRGRGRGRGKKRERGRGPGRPRKFVEEPEGDPEFEFEDSIKCLELRDDVLHSGDEEEKTESQHKKPHKDDENEVILAQVDEKVIQEVGGIEIGDDVLVKKEGDTSISDDFSLSSRTKWKSTRVRSKPSQLKKDYVMHSVVRKTRGQQNISKYDSDRISVLGQDRSLKSFCVSTNTAKFMCKKCDFSTFVLKAYRLHLKVHGETDPKYYMCIKCDFKTIKSREYKAHKHKHMSDDLFCLYCELQLSTAAEYQKHALKHEGEYPFFCLECDSKFRKRNQLTAHKPKHQLEKPFVCAICGSGFKWKHALKNHMVIHSATKDHLCDVCGFATAHKSQLKAHKLIHTGHMFKCPIQGCQFEAIKKMSLNYHMVTHTREKSHQCDICGQSFSLRKNMRRHMLLHQNARPYPCKMCCFSTTRYDKLKEHNLKRHSIGKDLVSKKALMEEQSELVNPANVTDISLEGNAIKVDGTISQEELQKTAQITVSQSHSSKFDIQETLTGLTQVGDEGAESYPIIASVHYTDYDSSGTVYCHSFSVDERF